jgi:very-short-patch-repair endonuclease
LLVANGLSGFEREFPLEWQGRVHRFDFAWPAERVILETNGRRRHDDVADYEQDNDKWSVPGRLGYRIVFATWNKVVHQPEAFIAEVSAALVTPQTTTLRP